MAISIDLLDCTASVSVICTEIAVYDQTEKVPYEYLPLRKIAICTAKIVIPTAKTAKGRQGTNQRDGNKRFQPVLGSLCNLKPIRINF